jgi:hypothetical protein
MVFLISGTVADVFLWGYLKEKVFARGPQDLDELQRYITEDFIAIPQDIIRRVCRTVYARCQACIELEGKQVKLHKRCA